MKKITPYIFPLIVLLIVLFLVYRWYSLRGQRNAETAEFGEGIQIENLSEDEAIGVETGVGDIETAPLEQPTQTIDSEGTQANSENTGTIRYEINGKKVIFSVLATIGAARILDNILSPDQGAVAPEATPDLSKEYAVYVRSLDGDNLTKAFVLNMAKGGLLGSASIPTDLLPVEVLVTDAQSKSEVMNNVLLRGVINESGELIEEGAE